LLSMTDPETFSARLREVFAESGSALDQAAEEGAKLSPEALLERWRASRKAVQEALRAAPEGIRVPWFGLPLSVASMATGRLMETGANGKDVADAREVHRDPTARLWHIARIGFRARDHAYRTHGLTPPDGPFHLVLTAPDGTVWTYGPAEATQRVSGSA